MHAGGNFLNFQVAAKLPSKQSALGGGKFSGGTKTCLASVSCSVSGILRCVIRPLFLTPCNDIKANNQSSRSTVQQFNRPNRGTYIKHVLRTRGLRSSYYIIMRSYKRSWLAEIKLVNRSQPQNKRDEISLHTPWPTISLTTRSKN